jgi:hypothetical protein
MIRRIDPLGGDEFDRLFECFRYTTFRLETLQRYTMPYEDEPLHRFLAGEPKSRELDRKGDWWRQLIVGARTSRKLMQRVHVVVEPLSDYMRYELAWPYLDNIAAGEDIRIIPIHAEEWPDDLPGYGYDYWLFDSKSLAVLHYDHEGRFIAVDLIDEPSYIVQANAWRDAALHRAISYEEYMSAHPELKIAPEGM